MAGQVVFAGPGQLPKYGAVGTFGIQGPGLQGSDIHLLPYTNYGFKSGQIYNIESSQHINVGSGLSGSHSDIRKVEVASLVWQAIEVRTTR